MYGYSQNSRKHYLAANAIEVDPEKGFLQINLLNIDNYLKKPPEPYKFPLLKYFVCNECNSVVSAYALGKINDKSYTTSFWKPTQDHEGWTLIQLDDSFAVIAKNGHGFNLTRDNYLSAQCQCQNRREIVPRNNSLTEIQTILQNHTTLPKCICGQNLNTLDHDKIAFFQEQPYCKTCLKFCEVCQTWQPRYRIQGAFDKSNNITYACKDCIETGFTHCSECNDIYQAEALTSMDQEHTINYCKRCLNKLCFFCEECQKHIYRKTSQPHWHDGKIYCKDCNTKIMQTASSQNTNHQPNHYQYA